MGAHWNKTAYPVEPGRLLRKKQIREGRLLERRRLLSTVLNILFFKRVSSCSYAWSFRSESFVPKLSPFVSSLSRFVPETLHVRVHEQISVVRPFPRTASKRSKVSKIQAKFWCVYLWLPWEKQLDYCLALGEWYFLNRAVYCSSLVFALVTLLKIILRVSLMISYLLDWHRAVEFEGAFVEGYSPSKCRSR